jgi:hypothetical protein
MREDLEQELRTTERLARFKIVVPIAALYLVQLYYSAGLSESSLWVLAAALLACAILGWLTGGVALNLLAWLIQADIAGRLSKLHKVRLPMIEKSKLGLPWRWEFSGYGRYVPVPVFLAAYLESCKRYKIEPFPWILTAIEYLGMVVFLVCLVLPLLQALDYRYTLVGLLASFGIFQLIQSSCVISLARAAMNDPRLCS